MTTRRRRLIEVAFPLEEVSEHSRREKNVRHGHISTLHIWWARRPLAACRAFIYASLVNDPDDPAEREELLKEVADVASWDAVRKPDQVVRSKAQGGSGLTGRKLLERARERILRDNDGKPPRLLDPFAGGGAIPLEALRLGCEVEASDLNPVAVLILKGTVEYPQKYGRPLAEQRANRPDDSAGKSGDVPGYILEAARAGQLSFGEQDARAAYEKNPLAADVRYWGNWMLEEARKELAQFYPPDPDGSVPVAYLWSRTVPCPNCGAEMPLIRQYWLAKKDNKKVALKPVVDRLNKRVDFDVVEGDDISGDPGEATTSRGDTSCLVCQQVVRAEYVQEAGRAGNLGQQLTSVVLEASGAGGKRYRRAQPEDLAVYGATHRRLASVPDFDDLPAIPDEPVAHDPRNIWVYNYGLDTFGKLFNSRQLVALTTFARLVRDAYGEMVDIGLGADYARAVATYLGLSVDRLADYNSTLARWVSGGAFTAGTFARQALPMVWDYSEVCLLQATAGAASGAVEWIALFIEGAAFASERAVVMQRDARLPTDGTVSIVTDPPYYDAINYGDLSDYFYVWAKRSLETIQPTLVSMPLTPKREQAIMNVYGGAGERKTSDEARSEYVHAMEAAFVAGSRRLGPGAMYSIVFAHTEPDAWATLIDGLLRASLVPDASWPIDTERETRTSASGQARLASSVWMACRPRAADAGPAFLGDLQVELRKEVEDKLLEFWQRGIRGADFFISAIGPALSVFGRHSKVLRPDGSEVTVREFLDLVRRESTRVALQQVLHQDDLGHIDDPTRAYVTWVWSYGKAGLDAGEAIALCLATGAELDEITRQHSIAEMTREKSKKVAKLRSIAARAREDTEFGAEHGARTTPLIEQLQHAAWLWGANKADQVARYRSQLGEQRWKTLRMLGQAVAECLPEGDEDRRIILGMLGSGAASGSAPSQVPGTQASMELPS